MLNTDTKGENNIFSVRLKELMRGNITQQQLADVLNVKRQTISLYLNGVSLPPIEKVVEIANYFNVSADYLIGLSSIKSTETSIKEMCEYTGLTERALQVLHLYAEYTEENPEHNFIKTLNFLIESAKESASAHFINLTSQSPASANLNTTAEILNKKESCADLLKEISIYINFKDTGSNFEVSSFGNVSTQKTCSAVEYITGSEIFESVMFRRIENKLKELRKEIKSKGDSNADN